MKSPGFDLLEVGRSGPLDWWHDFFVFKTDPILDDLTVSIGHRLEKVIDCIELSHLYTVDFVCISENQNRVGFEVQKSLEKFEIWENKDECLQPIWFFD